jgi:FtsH-binding integral membrane protein
MEFFIMANWSDPRMTAQSDLMGARGVSIDAGLRSYMLSVYNYMTSAVLLTGIVSYLFANSPYFEQVMFSPLRIVVMLAPLGFVMALSFGINRMSAGTAQALFWVYAVVMGISLSTIFRVYTGGSIATTFAATSASFAGLSLYGYTTKRDLGPWGTFLIMGLFGLIIAMLINMFFPIPGARLIIDIIGVLIFAGLTAYDTQKIKSVYFAVQGTEMMGKSAIMGALQLYLDFINMFLFLLRFMGGRR